jgi:chemotaxis methyl-accepting protein methylase
MKERADLQQLLEKIYCERGFDFREYKETTLKRRIGRRLRARGVDTYAGYEHVLSQDPAEYDRLFNDLTINVTSFFRDVAAFEALERIVLPAVISRNAGTGKIIRIWSAACATGEEPYSIAIMLMEILGRDMSLWDITVMATDIDGRVLKHAEDGIFGSGAVKGIRTPWLEKYFLQEKIGFRVQPVLRQSVIFERHDLTVDPPYRNLDLIVCRNVLIYFASPLQTRVFTAFHEGMKDGAFLLLGKAETPGTNTRFMFDCVDKTAKLFTKIRVNVPG